MLLVCGEALFDVFIGQTDGASVSLDARAGGSPYNVAIGLARLGRSAGFLAAISKDVLGQQLVDHLTAEGVFCAHLARKDNLTTLGFVGLAPDGSAHYTFYNENAADRQLASDDLPVLGDDVRALHIGSFSMVVEPTGSTLEDFVARESAKRFISYDPNVRPLIVPDPQVWRNKLERLSSHVHLLKMSDEDFNWLFPGVPPVECARRWLSRGVRVVVMTEGANGAVAWSGSEEIRVPGKSVSVVDTVGAGDTFQAALLCRLDETGMTVAPVAESFGKEYLAGLMQFAVRAAAVTCSRRGADLPRRSELDE